MASQTWLAPIDGLTKREGEILPLLAEASDRRLLVDS